MPDPRLLTRAFVAAVAVASLAAVATPGSDHHDAADAPSHVHAGEVAWGVVGVIDSGNQAIFWQTPPIACDGTRPTTGPSAPISCEGHDGFGWSIEVARSGGVLRVDFDQPYRQDSFRLEVTDPRGDTVTVSSQNTYSHGVRIDGPGRGTWQVDLTPLRTDGTVVQLRAGLWDERDRPIGATTEGALLPNLRATPPFEFGFAAPVNPTNSMFLASDDVNPALSVAGQEPVSCTADEVQEASDPTRNDVPIALVRCLRFTAGPQNVGAGHLDLAFPFRGRATAGNTDQVFEMTQIIHHVDGTRTERHAGTWEYHATHGHYHYVDVLYYELLAVRDAEAGDLEQVGLGRKSGLCPDDQGYGEWSSFQQATRGAVAQTQNGSCLPAFGAGNHAMGLSAGWGDYYRWQRPGQYVDFSFQPDGLYVVRVTVDILDNVLETNETDNSSYALIRVTGDDVEILERGQGQDPWDPSRLVHDDGRR